MAVSPLPVEASRFPSLKPFPMLFVHAELADIFHAIRVHQLSFSMVHSILPFALIVEAVLAKVFPLPVHLIIPPVALMNVALCVDLLSKARPLAILKLSFVDHAIFLNGSPSMKLIIGKGSSHQDPILEAEALFELSISVDRSFPVLALGHPSLLRFVSDDKEVLSL